MKLLLISLFSLAFAGTNTASISPTANTAIHQPTKAKTLELRYSTSLSAEKDNCLVQGQTFKVFSDKQSAVDYYYFIKNSAPEKVIYYIISSDEKTSEVFTFKAVE